MNVKIGNGKEVHYAPELRNIFVYKWLVTKCGYWNYNHLIQETDKPVTCKTCLKCMEKDNELPKMSK